MAEHGLFSRYRHVWRAAWRHRHTLAPVKRTAHELQFLPAALQLQDTPSHPAPRVLLWGIIGFAALALAWACLGRLDVVAVATGKVIPDGKSKVIQAADTAVVRAINVRDGQAVQAGEVLLTLDATTRDAEVQRLDGDRLAARLDLARASSMLLAIQGNREPAPVEQWLADVGAGQQAAARHWVAGQYQEYRTGLDALEAEIRQRDAEIQAAKGQIDSLRQALPIAARLAEDYQHLLEKQYVTRHAYLEKEQARLELLRQLGVQQASLAQAQAGRQQSLRRRDGEAAKAQRDMLDLQQQAGQKIASLDQELTKARYEQSLTELRAPVAGTVQQLAVHTLGGVVTPAQPLLTLVPSDQQVEVEALLENKDVGFVHAGQPASVKVETFNFTKYGTVAGEVVSVSQDAIEDEKRGLVYNAKVRLARSQLLIDGRNVALAPGMAVTVEIKTDQRRVIDYFLSPLEQHLQESLGER